MKLKNSTDYPDHFLRRMVAWCCEQIGYPVRQLKRVQVRNKATGYRGFARYSACMVSMTTSKTGYPTKPDHRPGMQGESFADRTEALVAITAHEVYHLAAHFVDEHKQRTRGDGRHHGSSEQRTRAEEVRVLRLFRANRESLIAAWSEPPVTREVAKPSIQEKRAEKALADLERWQRKAKLAATKIRKLKARVRYYEGVSAAKSQPKEPNQ